MIKKFMFTIQLLVSIMQVHGQIINIKYEGDKLSRKDSLRIDKISSYTIEFYKDIFSYDSIQLNYHVFLDKDAYTRYLLEHKIKMVDKRFIAKYSKKENACLIYRNMERDDDVFFSSIGFCTSSALLYQHKGPNPMWLSIGLNQYFKYMDFGRKTIKHELPIPAIAKVKSLVDFKQLDLHELVDMKGKQFVKEELTDESATYALSHLFVYYLIEKDFQLFKTIIRQIKAGTPSFEVLNANYPGGFTALSSDFEKYVQDK